MGDPRLGMVMYDRDGRPLTVDQWADLIGGWGSRERREQYRRVGSDQIGRWWVSTVWIGTDYRWDDSSGPPLIFETMVFSDSDWDGEYVDRASSWGEAVARHLVACAVVRCWLVLGRSVPGDGLVDGPRACPRCNRVSHHPTDQAEGYCGHCHDWTMKP